MRVIGLMSGTSYDAVDAAAADLAIEGDSLVLTPLGLVSEAYDDELRAALAAALPPAPTTLREVCALDTRIGQAFAAVAARADRELCGGLAELVVSHGQTVYHWTENGRVHGTLQIGQPAWIAEELGRPVVSDLRPRDVAAGGQGAPLVSLVDALWLRGRPGVPVALNLGGIANITVAPGAADAGNRADASADAQPAESGIADITVASATAEADDRTNAPAGARPTGGSPIASPADGEPAEPVVVGASGAPPADGASADPPADPLAFDTGPANALLDAAVQDLTGGGSAYDVDGALAARGRVDAALLEHLLDDPYYAKPPPKTTGKEQFHLPYLRAALAGRGDLRPEDVIESLTLLTARTVADAARSVGATEVIASGGGTRNPTLMALLRKELDGVPVRTSDELGLPSAAKEAYAFAVLGYLTLHGLPATLPTCTGARHPSVLGSITPGRAGLRLPPAPERAPVRLEIAAGGGYSGTGYSVTERRK
ncbi:anhydro-N-acetylmuramic acid kinase [Streptomyces pathocidini]|uniref:Anhydro-N-acetylmuramic acid kinase n=1 Tax=Streptomyces pathocidini TaxID=1650571 RepID=A0ABW7UUS8_9ACTN|nr:anhydro-N-acetylmuramic acid kinase [Streptomyces pathocidini]